MTDWCGNPLKRTQAHLGTLLLQIFILYVILGIGSASLRSEVKMSAVRAADDTSAHFIDFVPHLSTESLTHWLGEDYCLADVIEYWLTRGGGLRVCLCDYEVFLLTFIAITHQWAADPELLDYYPGPDPDTGKSRPPVKRRVQRIFREFNNEETRLTHPVLDRYHFNKLVFAELHGSGAAELL
ncbi:hypothetical protein QNN03_36635 [Streptomyces sp. GXMU-J15]|uniref:Uncharacterized protein n=1 Tax=Streptomyces fuscus TaxID=3048495 RepID=A0ABT7JAR4_9ACTN|nr:hypothetical protein [Streptomyces fuscus]MDL2081967.1 hypothetical protein [Streptomyces fuscus]